MKTSNSVIQKITSLRGTAMLGIVFAGLLAGGIVGERTIDNRTAASHRVPHAQPCHRGEAINRRTGQCYLPSLNDCLGGRSSNCPG